MMEWQSGPGHICVCVSPSAYTRASGAAARARQASSVCVGCRFLGARFRMRFRFSLAFITHVGIAMVRIAKSEKVSSLISLYTRATTAQNQPRPIHTTARTADHDESTVPPDPVVP
jgi:hypothetical protein